MVYNLAGDEDLRFDTTKAILLSAIIGGRSQDLAGLLTRSFTTGAGARQRNFFTWAQNNIADWMPLAVVDNKQEVSLSAVLAGIQGAVTLAANEQLRVTVAAIDDPDLTYWAEDWIRHNRPDLTDEDWTVDFDPNTAELIILITAEASVRLPPSSELVWALSGSGRRLLFADYTIISIDPLTLVAVESEPTMFVYRMGSGVVALDLLQSSTISPNEFYPALPLRINNRSIRASGNEALYSNTKKAYKKLLNAKVDDFLDTLEGNPDIGEIDFAFLVQGVPLNVKNNAGKQYLYEFFQHLRDNQYTNRDHLNNAAAARLAATTNSNVIDTWLAGNNAATPYNPNYGTLSPTFSGLWTIASQNTIRIYSDTLPNYDMRVNWNSIEETQHAGNAMSFDGNKSRGTAKAGDYWFKSMPAVTLGGVAYDRILLFYQYATLRYSRLEVLGLSHTNYVYIGLTVGTSGSSALDAAEVSGFILPLHSPTLRAMGLRKSSQLASSSSYIVLNVYQQYKKKWYQTGIFKVILFIVVVAISLVFPPAGGMLAAGGVLGTNVAIGMALGATSVMVAAIIGAIANQIAAMVITSIISKGATELFGDKLGAIVATIASFVAIQYGSQYSSTGNFDVDWGKIFRADNIINLTGAVSDAYTGWVNADTMDLYGEMETAKSDYQTELDRMQKAANEILGMTNLNIDPMMFTDATNYFDESRKTFLTRTLLTGSDIAALTLSMITDFPVISLELPSATL